MTAKINKKTKGKMSPSKTMATKKAPPKPMPKPVGGGKRGGSC